MTEEEARERIKELKSFHGHALSYVVVNIALFTLFSIVAPTDALIGPGLVALFWGVGLAIHAFKTFGFMGLGSRKWEEQKVRELMSSSSGLTRDDLSRELKSSFAQIEKSHGVDADRILRRLEHLEAIVTSEDWDLISESSPSKDRTREKAGEPLIPEPEESDDPETTAERIARRVR